MAAPAPTAAAALAPAPTAAPAPAPAPTAAPAPAPTATAAPAPAAAAAPAPAATLASLLAAVWAQPIWRPTAAAAIAALLAAQRIVPTAWQAAATAAAWASLSRGLPRLPPLLLRPFVDGSPFDACDRCSSSRVCSDRSWCSCGVFRDWLPLHPLELGRTGLPPLPFQTDPPADALIGHAVVQRTSRPPRALRDRHLTEPAHAARAGPAVGGLPPRTAPLNSGKRRQPLGRNQRGRRVGLDFHLRAPARGARHPADSSRQRKCGTTPRPAHRCCGERSAQIVSSQPAAVAVVSHSSCGSRRRRRRRHHCRRRCRRQRQQQHHHHHHQQQQLAEAASSMQHAACSKQQAAISKQQAASSKQQAASSRCKLSPSLRIYSLGELNRSFFWRLSFS